MTTLICCPREKTGKIVIPEKVTSIEKEAFYECKSLSSISIPEGMISIGKNVFVGCSSLKEIVVNKNNITYTSKNGMLYTKDMTKLICCPAGKTGKISIPKGVTFIGSYAFSGCSNLSSISIPKGMTTIGSYAFYECKNLSSINMPTGMTTIGTYSFYGCSSLSSISIPKEATFIGASAFEGCKSLSSINIPENVTSIRAYAFEGCSSLKEIVVSEKNKTYASENGILYTKDMKKLLCCPARKTGKINIPDSMIAISDYAFSGCNHLKEITVNKNNMSYTAKNGILYSKDMTKLVRCPAGKTGKISIPDSVISIKPHAFSGCSSLSSISIPKGVTSIGNAAFSGCSKNLTLTIVKGSYAEIYARENNINYSYKKECKHDYKSKVTKATTKKNGSIAQVCSKCGAKKGKATVIYAAKNIKLSKTSVTYNNKIQKPSVTIKDSKGKSLKKNKDYTVTYPKNTKNVGKYNIKIQLKGNYKDTITKTFTIKPKAVSLTKVTPKSKGFVMKWKKQTQQVTGYQISYSTSKKFVKKSTKTAYIKKAKTTTKTISKLKAKKKYYVRIRTYKDVKIKGKTTKIYSSWSKIKTVTTKK